MGQPLVLSRASTCRQGGLAGEDKHALGWLRQWHLTPIHATSRWMGVLALAIAAAWSKTSSIEDGATERAARRGLLQLGSMVTASCPKKAPIVRYNAPIRG
jgi:hypothetical protein